MTIKGKTQDVVIPATSTAQGKAGVFAGRFTLRRGDFAIGEGSWAKFDVVANEVQIQSLSKNCSLKIKVLLM